MNDYERNAERRELSCHLSDGFMTLYKEWEAGEMSDIRFREVEGHLRPEDADKLRMLGCRLCHRLMQIADTLDEISALEKRE